MKTLKFIKTGRDWYIDLPEFLEQGGSMGDLQMVEGADEMLEMMAAGKDHIRLTISREVFIGSDVLTLTERCDPIVGGGYYLMRQYEGQQINRTMWLCQVIEFVFGEIPSEIFVRREKQ